jgi:hypothetical protein
MGRGEQRQAHEKSDQGAASSRLRQHIPQHATDSSRSTTICVFTSPFGRIFRCRGTLRPSPSGINHGEYATTSSPARP